MAVVPRSGPSVRLSRSDGAGVFADDALRDPEAEAGAALALGGEEGLEEVLADLGGDAGAVVGDLDDGARLAAALPARWSAAGWLRDDADGDMCRPGRRPRRRW